MTNRDDDDTFDAGKAMNFRRMAPGPAAAPEPAPDPGAPGYSPVAALRAAKVVPLRKRDEPLPLREWDEIRPPLDVGELERLTYVPGLVGDIIEHIVRSATRPNRMMALGSALVLCGTLMGHRVRGPTRSATHIFFMNIAPPGSGKDHPLQMGSRYLDSVGKSALIGPGGLTSGPGLEDQMLQDPLMACFIDELGDELAKINSRGSGANPWLASTIGILKKCYNAFDVISTAARRNNPSVRIYWPAVSIYGAATPEKFFGSFTASDIESGFVSRFMVLPPTSHLLPPEQVPPLGADEVPEELKAMLLRIPRRQAADIKAKLSAINGAFVAPPLLDVGWTPEAAEVYLALSREMDGLVEADQRRYEISRRGAENAVRIATVVAVCRGSPVITVADMAHAVALSRRSLDTLCGGIERYMREYVDLPKLCDAILAHLATCEAGFEAMWKLERKFGRNSRTIYDLPNAIALLKRQRRVVECDRPGTRPGRTAEGLRLLREGEAWNGGKGEA